MGTAASGAVALDADGDRPNRRRADAHLGARHPHGLRASASLTRKSRCPSWGRMGTPSAVTVDWAAKTCTVNGATRSARRWKSNNALSVVVDLHGTLVNQPPTANAGADQTVECTSAAGAEITLDGTRQQ